MTEIPAAPLEDIVARAGRYYRNARYVICAMALGAGLWFAYDGWIGYQQQRDDYFRKTPEERAKGHEPHSETDIALQKKLAFGLIPLAPLLLGIFLYRSRGEYRLSGTTLFVPGHPPIPVDAIVALDKTKWKRKGIAYVDYKLDGSDAEVRLTLDDFVYEQIPTDKIVDQLDAWLNPEGMEEGVAEGNSPGTGLDEPTDQSEDIAP